VRGLKGFKLLSPNLTVLLTTSRKPSRRTRSLAKVLARFMNWRYINRGKLSLNELFKLSSDEGLAIIEEVKGNPAILKIINPKDESILLKIRFNVSNVIKVKMDDSPVVFIGKVPFDPVLLEAIPQSKAGLKLARKVDFKKKVFVRRSDEFYIFEFYYEDLMVFKMKVKRDGF